uniref:Uncharacterized protein n=1 Tax=Ralstonia solanacearum TaxID=305 RepID=A0A0S4W8G8_RALSL|nr:protein of unknown function [Ralstonia solanacearum]
MAVHALIGGLISRAMGGEFVAGAAGAGAAALVLETFRKGLGNVAVLRHPVSYTHLTLPTKA